MLNRLCLAEEKSKESKYLLIKLDGGIGKETVGTAIAEGNFEGMIEEKFGIAHHRCRAAIVDYLTLAEDDRPGAEFEGEVEVMGSDELGQGERLEKLD